MSFAAHNGRRTSFLLHKHVHHIYVISIGKAFIHRGTGGAPGAPVSVLVFGHGAERGGEILIFGFWFFDFFGPLGYRRLGLTVPVTIDVGLVVASCGSGLFGVLGGRGPSPTPNSMVPEYYAQEDEDGNNCD